jgi:hypothetical protein
MWLLLGWQFAVAEFLGGAIMIVLLAIALPRIAQRDLVAAARAERTSPAEERTSEQTTFGDRLRDPSRRRAAARYTLADLGMLRREIVVGFVVAGFLAVGVPSKVWTSVFVTGHGTWTAIENALLGPAVAMVSFVCSIGNVPLAAALWQRGVSFGGVVAFVFADLLSIPLLLIYRRLYGGRLTARLIVVLWAAMSVAGLLTQALMRGLGGVPDHRPRLVSPEHFAWNYTTVVNVIALAVFAVIIRTARRRDPAAGGAGYAVDPVCGMQVERDSAPAAYGAGDDRVYFCSERCRDKHVEKVA